VRNSFLSALEDKYFGERLDFRAQIFNTLGILGCAMGLLFGAFAIFNYAGPQNVIANFGASIAAAWIIWYANRTGAFKTFFLITVILVFFILFPVLFFMGGGYCGGMPSFFVFAVVFTVIMLEGRRRAVCAVLEFALYTGCFLTALFRPETVVRFPTETASALDVVVGCLGASAALAIAIVWHISIYDKKQKELEQANAALDRLDRAKTEFVANASHEMQTPLTVVSVNVQTVADILDELPVKNDEAEKLLKDAQNEILRLSRAVDGLLTLTSVSGNADRRKTDFSALQRRRADAFRRERGGAIETDVEDGLTVFGNADLLARAIDSLLRNADPATLAAARNGGEIVVTISGGSLAEIPPLCKTVIESHGGGIGIEREANGGAKLTLTLPTYQGQFGGESR
jgi:signal transduction histidine kinase